MTDDKLKSALQKSAKNISMEIAVKTKQHKELQKLLDGVHNQVTMTEAQIEVAREKRDEIQANMREIKAERSKLFEEKDRVLAEKNSYYDQLDAGVPSVQRDEIFKEIERTKEQVGKIIEENNTLRDKIQEMHEQAQVEHENMIKYQDDLKKRKEEARYNENKYARELAELGNELTSLRRKMQEIQSRLKE